MKKLLLVVVILFLCSSVFGATLEEGLAAARMGNYPAALKIFRELSEKGNAVAQFNLGNMYDQGQGVPKDTQEAVEWLHKAAEQGHDSAQNNLGTMYAAGKGVTKDNMEAVKWYRKASDQGNSAAQVNLGLMYDRGEGLPQDDAEAYFWMNLAASQDPDDSNVKLCNEAAAKLTPVKREEIEIRCKKWLENFERRSPCKRE